MVFYIYILCFTGNKGTGRSRKERVWAGRRKKTPSWPWETKKRRGVEEEKRGNKKEKRTIKKTRTRTQGKNIKELEIKWGT